MRQLRPTGGRLEEEGERGGRQGAGHPGRERGGGPGSRAAGPRRAWHPHPVHGWRRYEGMTAADLEKQSDTTAPICESLSETTLI